MRNFQSRFMSVLWILILLFSCLLLNFTQFSIVELNVNDGRPPAISNPTSNNENISLVEYIKLALTSTVLPGFIWGASFVIQNPLKIATFGLLFAFELVGFFIHIFSPNSLKELQANVRYSTASFSSRLNSKLYEKMNEVFDLNDIRVLCFRLNIEFENLSNKSKSWKLIDLIESCKRTQKMQELFDELRKARPRVNWDEIFS